MFITDDMMGDPEGCLEYSGQELASEIRKLRRIICAQTCVGAYMDDGEASYGGHTLMGIRPFDFLRSSSEQIEKFIREYHLACYNFKIENEMLLNPAP